MRLSIRGKLVLLSLAILVVVSFSLTLVHLHITRAVVEDDMAERAVAFAREIAATIGDVRELESSVLMERQVRQILEVRPNVLQLDMLSFTDGAFRVVATSHPRTRLPFTRAEAARVRRGEVVSRLVVEPTTRYSEVIAPVVLDAGVAGAVAAKFSPARGDAVAATSRWWALLLTALSVLVMGLLMSGAVEWVVIRPINRFLLAVRRVQRHDTTATVNVDTRDEFGELAQHFNVMMGRVHDFRDELEARVKEATSELEGRYQEVERLNETLFSVQRRLGHAERLALTGRLMAQVAHEVGTPLHSVAGHVELLRRDLPAGTAPDAVVRRLDVIEGQLTRVTEIIAQLLDLTRREPTPPAPVDVNRLVLDTIEVVRPSIAQHQLTLGVATAPSLPPVLGRANQLQQVVLNLLTNAMDATPPGGRLRVVTRLSGAHVEVAVNDTGRGIPAEQQARIFEPFFSTKAMGHGTGLGLFVSAQIVREHRGRIEVSSVEGGGDTTFRVLVPAAPEAA